MLSDDLERQMTIWIDRWTYWRDNMTIGKDEISNQ
jgi:hypothetical protein